MACCENTEFKVTSWAGRPRAESTTCFPGDAGQVSLSIKKTCCKNRGTTHKSVTHWLLVPNRSSLYIIHWFASYAGEQGRLWTRKRLQYQGTTQSEQTQRVCQASWDWVWRDCEWARRVDNRARSGAPESHLCPLMISEPKNMKHEMSATGSGSVWKPTE